MASISILTLFKDSPRFYIPPMDISLDLVKINPAYDADKVNLWCLEFLDLHDITSYKAQLTIESRLGLSVAYAYPSISTEKMLAIAKFVAWLFLADEILDNPSMSASDVENAVVAYGLVYNEQYDEAIKLVSSRDLLRQLKMFNDLYKELLLFMEPQQKVRFRDSMVKSLNMFKVESSWLHKNVVPNMETYMWMREEASAILPFFVAIDFLHGFGLDKETLEHPLIQEVEKIGLYHIALHNDIVSFKAQWSSNNYLNAVPLIAYNDKCSLNEAIAKVACMVEDLEKNLKSIRLKISSSSDGLGSRKGVMDYVTGIETWVAGNVEWGWTTARYYGLGWVAPVIKEGTFPL